jgi:hypothetical protein
MYENIVLPVQNLRKTTEIKPAGLCRIIFFRRMDVLTWPQKSPVDGVIYDGIQLKEGTVYYSFQPADKERIFSEDLKQGNAGPFVDITVNGRMGGNTLNHITALDAMMHFDFGVLVQERNGEIRLIGNEDSGADVSFGYTSGDIDTSRISSIKFTWQHPQRAPIYESDMIIVDDTIIPIGSGSPTVQSGSLNEVVPFSGTPTYTLMWTQARKLKFGNAAVIQIYIIGEDGKLRWTAVEVKPDAISNPTKYEIDFGGVSTGVIIIS